MTSDDTLNIGRILMALDPSARGRSALQLVRELIGSAPAEVHGLFMEDIDLLSLAGLPFARELALTSAVGRRLEQPRLERALHGQAEQVQRHLSEFSGRTGLSCSFQVLRGRFPRDLLALAEGFDVCIVGRESASGVQRLSRADRPAGRTVVVVLADSPVSARALQGAMRLASAQERRLLVLWEQDVRPVAALDAVLQREFGSAESLILPTGGIPALRRLLAARLPLALLLDRAHPLLLQQGGMDALLAELNCPLILFR